MNNWSKAYVLSHLRPLLKNAVVLDQVDFTVADWCKDKISIIDRIIKFNSNVIVRSSARIEDSLESSQAGHFTSVLNVAPNELEHAIGTVIASYDGSNDNAVLVQPYLENVQISGVILTQYPESGAPYFTITIDTRTGTTNGVTSGSVRVENYIVYRNASLSMPIIKRIVDLARHIEMILGHDSLDIEFAVKDDVLYVFQVRPLVVTKSDDIGSELQRGKEFIKTHLGISKTLNGSTTAFSNMSDWNPAEMIGICPRPLAYSLYKMLVTDRAWAKARALIGYRYVSDPLMVEICGAPYIDVRASLNSFLPSNIETNSAHHIANNCLLRLLEHPELHDKIEFDIAVTCASLDLDQRLEVLNLPQATLNVFKQALLTLTDNIIIQAPSFIPSQLDCLTRLSKRRLAIKDLPPGTQLYCLIEDCIEYGVVPFSILARYTFIGMAYLKSMVKIGILTSHEYQSFLETIPTIASHISSDIAKLRAGSLSDIEFASMYGHLRMDTYNIMAPNYAELLPTFKLSGPSMNYPACREANAFDIKSKYDKIQDAISAYGMSFNSHQLFEFIINAIKARELGKFEFTKNIDKIMCIIKLLGQQRGLTSDDLSYVSIEDILRNNFEYGSAKERYIKGALVKLPNFIAKLEDLEYFKLMEDQPNFITDKKIIAEIVALKLDMDPRMISSRVVLMQGADPGYDWIFSYNPAGLITQFGGAASHMAIRAAEFGLPSAVGCGENLYNNLKHARRIELDCLNGRIRIIA